MSLPDASVITGTSKEVFDYYDLNAEGIANKAKNPEIGDRREDMAESYIISIDQSTQGTKALLFDQDGMLFQRKDLPHKQIINEKGWVSHDPEEIYQNTVQVVKNLVEASGISKESVKGIGISNQRETSLVWEKETGKAIAHAVVWQCARAAEICRRVEKTGAAEMIRKKQGLRFRRIFRLRNWHG